MSRHVSIGKLLEDKMVFRFFDVVCNKKIAFEDRLFCLCFVCGLVRIFISERNHFSVLGIRIL